VIVAATALGGVEGELPRLAALDELLQGVEDRQN